MSGNSSRVRCEANKPGHTLCVRIQNSNTCGDTALALADIGAIEALQLLLKGRCKLDHIFRSGELHICGAEDLGGELCQEGLAVAEGTALLCSITSARNM